MIIVPTRAIIQAATLLFLASLVSAGPLARKTIEVDGVDREYLLHAPETGSLTPLVFVFHGHGGNMQNTSRSFRIHELWPEACVVYMQGLKTPGQLTDPEGKRNGWQHAPGDQGDRDLKFFDAVFKSLEEKIDARNVFSTGHSNGGGFTYLLWHARADKFRAMAPSSAAANKFLKGLSPKPVIHYAGRQDPLVKYAWQRATLMQVHANNKCKRQGKPWHGTDSIEGTIYLSATHNPVVTLISDEGHKFPREAPDLFVRFFKEQLINPEPVSETDQEPNDNIDNNGNTTTPS